MKIPEFLKEFVKAKPEPARIEIGDDCRNKETGEQSMCMNIDDGIYYGKTASGIFIMSKIEKIEKL